MGSRTVAYLVNQYPKTSHTFIRREIATLEEQGLKVERFSIRRTREVLADPADQAEVSRTRSLLDVGAIGLFMGLLRASLTHPVNLLRALGLAMKAGWRSERGLLLHLVYLAEAAVLVRWVGQSSCAHLHAHFGTNSATVAMLCRELGGPPFSFTVHGPEEFDKVYTIALDKKVERAAFVAAISSFGRSQILRHLPFEWWSKVHIVRCGVDRAFLEAAPTPVPEERRFVCVGRLCEQKGQIVLVEAAAQLRDRGYDFEIHLVGDGEMRHIVERAISRHRLEGRVVITGWRDGAGVKDEIMRARALVLPSFAEGLPVVIMEALALGRPVVSTFVAGIPELVESGKSGWLVPAGSIDALADAMEHVMKAEPSHLTRMGLEGRQRVTELHDISIAARSLAELFAQEDGK